MTLARLVIFAFVLALGACSASRPIAPPGEADAEILAKDHIYLAGHTPDPAPTGRHLGLISGLACRDAIFGPAATEADALKDLRKRVTELKTTAIVDVACGETSPWIVYRTAPYAAKACWPGVVCRGQAIR